MYQNQIDKAEKELAALRAKQEKLDSMKPEESLAFQLHELTCTWNHNDGCGWFWEKEADLYRPGSARNRWLEAAKKMLAIESDVNKIIQLIKIGKSI